jgi:hypothetical protein
MNSWLTVLTAALSIALVAGCGPPPEGERGGGDVTVLTGPRFWTGDARTPWAEGLVVEQGRVVALAGPDELRRALAGGGIVRELPGAVAVPGLTDAHAHLLGYGLGQRRAQLVGAENLAATLERVQAFAAAHPDDRWVLGRGWDQNDWVDTAWPDAKQLDQVVPERPAALRRIDGHALWVNTAALEAAGIDAETPDPPGGRIVRDEQGAPTGILVDAAMSLVTDELPPPSDQERREALELAGERLLAEGLTGVHDMGMDAATWQALRELAGIGRFPLRITAYAAAEGELAEKLVRAGPQAEGRLRLLGIKLYADGALGSRGARLLEPYADEPGHRGLWVLSPEVLTGRVRETMAAGLQPAVHAIGDAANRAVLEAVAAAVEHVPTASPPSPAARPRIEHAQVLDPGDIERWAAIAATLRERLGGRAETGAGIVASMQPTHATSDMPWVGERLGPDRLAGAYAWRSLSERGVPLALGSDFPVERSDPRAGLYAAVTRQDAGGQPPGGFRPSERLTLEQALHGFTAGAAWAAFQEDELGRLAPGYWCDLTVFGRNPWDEPPQRLLDNPVVATVIAGQVVWQGP